MACSVVTEKMKPMLTALYQVRAHTRSEVPRSCLLRLICCFVSNCKTSRLLPYVNAGKKGGFIRDIEYARR